MKKKINKPEPAPSNLESWITDPRADGYFGKSFALRVAVLSAVTSGKESLSSVARRHGASRQAASRHWLKAKAVFGLTTGG